MICLWLDLVKLKPGIKVDMAYSPQRTKDMPSSRSWLELKQYGSAVEYVEFYRRTQIWEAWGNHRAKLGTSSLLLELSFKVLVQRLRVCYMELGGTKPDRASSPFKNLHFVVVCLCALLLLLFRLGAWDSFPILLPQSTKCCYYRIPYITPFKHF